MAGTLSDVLDVLEYVMAWMTPLNRKLEADVANALEGAERNALGCLRALAALARTHLDDGIVETVKISAGVIEVTALERLGDFLLPRTVSLADSPSMDLKSWAEGIVQICRSDEGVRLWYDGMADRLVSGFSDKVGVSVEEQACCAEILYGAGGPLRLKHDALMDPRLCRTGLIVKHQELGIDINANPVAQDGIWKPDGSRQQRLLHNVLFGRRGYEDGPRSHLSIGAWKADPANELRFKAWVEHGGLRLDLSWIWGAHPKNPVVRIEGPALEWAGHSPAFVRYVIDEALVQAGGSNFPAWWINKCSPGDRPLLHYAMAHGLDDLVDRLYAMGADPHWVSDSASPLSVGVNGSFVKLGGHFRDWYQRDGARTFIDSCVVVDAQLVAKHWRQQWDADGFFVSDGSDALTSPMAPLVGSEDIWSPGVATLVRHGLASVERVEGGFSVTPGDVLRECLQQASAQRSQCAQRG